MSEVRIYKIDLSAGDISIPWSTVFWPTSHGGSDTPDANYPELSKSENIVRRESFGEQGQHVVDADETLDYTTAYINLCELGPLANGQYDVRGGTPLGHGPLKVRWRQQFSSSSLGESSIRIAICLTTTLGGTSLHPVGNTGELFLELWAVENSAPNFDWHLRYRKVSGSFFNLNSSNLNGDADVADDAEHVCILTLVPSTVTGAFNGAGGVGSASVASDGSITLTVDGVEVLSGTGLQFVVNHLATTNPEVYYGVGLYHGNNASLFGYISDTELYYETEDAEDPEVDESTPCCGSDVDSPDGETTVGELPPPNPYIPLPPWEGVVCSGEGFYLTSGDPIPLESWDF